MMDTNKAALLSQSSMSRDNAHGLTKCLAYYGNHSFCIPGCSELYNLLDTDFELGVDRDGCYEHFNESQSRFESLST